MKKKSLKNDTILLCKMEQFLRVNSFHYYRNKNIYSWIQVFGTDLQGIQYRQPVAGTSKDYFGQCLRIHQTLIKDKLLKASQGINQLFQECFPL